MPAASFNAGALFPPELADRPQWLVWKFLQKPGQKKPSKIPYYAEGSVRKGRQGSDEDRAKLVTYEQAVRAASSRGYDGVGFAFLPGDGLIGIDLDGCTGSDERETRARRIIEACRSYTERSPSGNGYHIIVAGQTETFKSDDIGVEVFCGSQFFTMTGSALDGWPVNIAQISEDALAKLRKTVMQARGVSAPSPRQDGDQAPPPAYRPPVDIPHSAKVESALAMISPDCGYEDWIRVGMAIHAALGEGAVDVWDRWSSRGATYKGGKDIESHWKSFRAGGVGEGTLFKMAMDAGWRPPVQRLPRPAAPAGVDPDTGEVLDAQTRAIEPPAPANDNSPLSLFSEDDLAAGHVARMAGNTLWCERWGTWMQWTGDRWTRDETLSVADQVRQSMRIAARMVFERQDIKPDAQLKMAEKLCSHRVITNVERLARLDRSVATHPDEWDADTWELNTPAGVVDLRTGTLRPHTRADRMTKLAAVSPAGDCPTWLQFLDTATQGDTELIGFLRRMCGYSLTGQIREHALFFVYGTGGNGKGTFLNTITHIMGDYQRVAGAETFTESHGDRHTTELARLQGARLVTAQETEEGKRWAEARIKALTGGDPITARFMRQDDFTFLPQFKLVIVGNHKPSFRNVDEAIKRRLHLIPFTASVPPERRDPKLSEKLRAEAPGILAWMIQGCIEWQSQGLRPPAIVKDSTDDYLGAEDSLQQWLDECCDLVPGFASSAALFKAWREWAEDQGEFVGTTKRLMSKLESRGVKIGQKYRGVRGCTGIRLKAPPF